MAKQGPETRLLNKMRKAATAKYGERLVVIKQHGGPYSRAGVSDLIGCLDGVFFACEVKAPESYGGSVERAEAEGPSENQKTFIAHVQDAGGFAWVAASVENFMSVLDEIAAHYEICEVM